VTIAPTVASATELGCVKPVAKTSAMLQAVGVDSNGLLYTQGVTIDTVVMRNSSSAVSGNAVYSFVDTNLSAVSS